MAIKTLTRLNSALGVAGIAMLIAMVGRPGGAQSPGKAAPGPPPGTAQPRPGDEGPIGGDNKPLWTQNSFPGKPVQYGKYLCITDRAVGLQSSQNSTERYAGSIQLQPEKQKFIATIIKIGTVGKLGTALSLDDVTNRFKEGVEQHMPERCFSAKSVTKLEEEWQQAPGWRMSYDSPNVEDFTESCLARSAVKLNGEATYYSLGENVFFSNLGDRFWISNDWHYSWVFGNGMGDHYMIEGRCDLLK